MGQLDSFEILLAIVSEIVTVTVFHENVCDECRLFYFHFLLLVISSFMKLFLLNFTMKLERLKIIIIMHDTTAKTYILTLTFIHTFPTAQYFLEISTPLVTAANLQKQSHKAGMKSYKLDFSLSQLLSPSIIPFITICPTC